MNDRRRFTQLVEEVDFSLARRRHLRERGVHLMIMHSHHVTGTLCAPGEMVEDIALGGQSHPISLGLSQASLLLMDCLCRYRLPLTARRIEQIMNTDPFYCRYAADQPENNACVARPDQKSVRVYVSRIRSQMERVFREIGWNMDPDKVLLAQSTDSNTLLYKLKATSEIMHSPYTRGYHFQFSQK